MLGTKSNLIVFITTTVLTGLVALGCDNSDEDQNKDTGAKGNALPPTEGCPLAIPIQLSVPSTGFSGTVFEDATEGAIETPGNIDHFSLEVTEGDYLYLATDSSPPIPEALPMLDPVISVYDETGATLIATGDDQVPRINADSEIFYRANFTGTICLTVQDGNTWRGEEPQAETENWAYQIIAAKVEEIGGVAVDNEANDDTSTAQPMLVLSAGIGSEFGLVCGALEDDQDEDYYSLTLPSGNSNVALFPLPFGTGSDGADYSQGHGSTLDNIIFEQLNSAGEIFASIDMSEGLGVIEAPATDDLDVYVRVRATDSMTSGDNDFYCLRYVSSPANATTETEVAGSNSNDNMATAEPLTFTDTQVRIQGSIDSLTDFDYYSFDGQVDDVYRLICWSATNGSGLIGATFALHGPDDSVLQTETETIPNYISWSEYTESASMPEVTGAADGTHYFVVSGQGQKSDMVGSYYSCFLYQN